MKINFPRHHHSRVSQKKGLAPGSAVYIGSSPPKKTTIEAYKFKEDNFEKLTTITEPEILNAIKSGFHVWIDICGLQDVDRIVKLCKSLSIHPLMIEDIVNTHQRPKLEVINDYEHAVFKLLDTKQEHYNYVKEQMSILNNNSLILTVRESDLFSFQPLFQKLLKKQPYFSAQNCLYLKYLIIDAIIDDYFRFIEATGDQIREMEDKIISNPNQLNLHTLYTTKRRITTLATIIAPMRDVIHLLLAKHSEKKHDPFQLYYRDLYDHCLRLLEQTTLQSTISGNLLDMYLSIQNNRMNETMKVLTLFASIFIPLSFIASVYGMNFTYMPELKLKYGYPMVLLFMLSIVVIMLWYFKRRKIL